MTSHTAKSRSPDQGAGRNGAKTVLFFFSQTPRTTKVIESNVQYSTSTVRPPTHHADRKPGEGETGRADLETGQLTSPAVPLAHLQLVGRGDRSVACCTIKAERTQKKSGTIIERKFEQRKAPKWDFPSS